MFPTEEVKCNLESPVTFMQAIADCEKIYPGLKPIAIAKMLDAYRTRLKESFGIMDGE